MPHRARDTAQTKTSRLFGFCPNRLLVEDLTAFGYPRPAPLLAASDHAFFDDTIAGSADRSMLIYLFSSPRIKLYLGLVIPGRASSARTRNPEVV
jgi:hypothetical protein